MSTTPWRDDWRYHSDWTNWQDWSSSSECHDTKDAWSTPAYETPASDGVRQEPVTWTEARSSRQETPTSNNNEASGSNDAETDLNEKVKSGDVYWCDRTTPKMTMRSLRAEFQQCPTLTGNLHECVNEIIDNWTTFMLSVTFNTAQDVYFPKFKPRECGYWKKLSIEEVHQHSHSNILRMIARNKPAEDPLAICDAGSSTDRWKLTGITVREPEKVNSKFSITGDNLFSSKEICHVVNDPNLEKCDKMIFENLAPVPNYTEDEEVVTLYHTTDLSRLQDTVEHGLSTYFGVGCIDTSAIYGCPVPLGYASTVEPTWSYIQNDECMLVLLASEQNAVFKRDTQRGFINPGADMYIKHIICKSAIKSEPDNAEGEADKWTPIYCETCEHWTNGLDSRAMGKALTREPLRKEHVEN